ncbi:MAG: tetratricopeptide repeat protein [Bacteroidales bacterium]|nr:tetratricopeptide repeat protein [Bacteroidales bacterium]
MTKPVKHWLLILLLSFMVASCGNNPVHEKTSSSPNKVISAFKEFLNSSSEIEVNLEDSTVYANFIQTISLLKEDALPELYKVYGDYYFKKEISDSAIKYYKQGLKIAENQGNGYYIAAFHLAIGNTYTYISNFSPALEELKIAYKLSLDVDSSNLQIKTSRFLGNVYWNLGNYDLALDYYLISLTISQKANSKLGISSSLNNIGNVYQEIKDYKRAIQYYKLSEEIAEEENFVRILAISNNNLGEVFSIKGQYDSALIYFKKALNYLENSSSRYDAGIYIGNVADLYLKVDSIDKSQEYFFKSLNYAKEAGDKTGIATCELGLAELYFYINKKDIGASYLKEGTSISESIGSLKLMEKAYRLNAQYSSGKKDFSHAYIYLNKQLKIKDSIRSIENSDNIARLENQYKEVQSIKEIEILKEKQKGFLYLSILGFSAFLIISLVILYAYRQKNKSNLILKEKNLQIEANRKILEQKHRELIASQEELRKINKGKDDFLTIISHDLKNPLGSIRGFVELLLRSYDSLSDEQRQSFLREVFDSIERISLLINNVLYWVKSQTNGIHSKAEGFNLQSRINDNLSIYKLLLSNKEISAVNNVSEDIQVVADKNIFDMVIRNIISNSLKFTEANGTIVISALPKPDKVEITITDTGIGIPEDMLSLILQRKEQYSSAGTRQEQGTGLGLGLIIQFIEETGESISISSTEGKGTSISFTLPAGN